MKYLALSPFPLSLSGILEGVNPNYKCVQCIAMLLVSVFSVPLASCLSPPTLMMSRLFRFLTSCTEAE